MQSSVLYPSIESNRLLYVSVEIYALLIMLDPTDSILHLKIVGFLFCLGCWAICKMPIRYTWEMGVFFFLLVFAAYGIMIAHIDNEVIDEKYQLAFIKTQVCNILIFPLSCITFRNQQKIFLQCSVILAVFIVFVYILSTYLGLEEAVYAYSHEVAQDTIMMSNRVILGHDIYAFFHKASPVLLFGVTYAILKSSKKNFLLSLLLCFPLLISGSRTPVLCGILALCGGYYIKYKIPRGIKIFIVVFGFIGLVFILSKLIGDTDESSAMLKFGAAGNYFNSLFGTPKSLLLGRGVGSLIFIPGRGFEPQSELSYFDLFNWFGFIVGGFYTLVLFSPSMLIFAKKKILKGFGLAYFLYMMIAMINPLLFSSTGWFVVICGIINLMNNRPRNAKIRYGNLLHSAFIKV